jgi:hypothetical protein
MRTINKLRVVHYAFTPEIRFYLGKKGYGEGFYIAPFYRNGYYEAKGVGLDFLKDNGQDDTLQFNAQIKSNTFGILLGAQWKLGKRFMLDMQFFGPHFGNSTLVITGRPRYEMTIDEQDNLEALGQFLSEEVRNNLINAGVPFKNEIIKKDPNRIQLKANSIWGGLRAGITLGWKF